MLKGRSGVGLAISLTLLGLLFWRIDLSETIRSLREANYVFVLPGLLFYSFALVFRAIRWRLLLLPLRNIPLRRLLPVVVVGYMANNLLPIRMGELVRSYYLGQREGVSKSASLATIVAERVFDGITMLFFIVVASAFLPIASLVKGLADSIGLPWYTLAVGSAVPFISALGLLVLIAYRPHWPVLWLSFFIRFLPNKTGLRITSLANLFMTGLGVLRHPRHLGALFLLSIPVWVAEAAMYYVIGFSFGLSSHLGGLVMMAVAMLVITATSNLATALPSSQGGIGPFEFFTTATMVILGVPEELAAAYALTLHVALLLPVTLTGFLYLWAGNDSLSKLVHRGKADTSRGRA